MNEGKYVFSQVVAFLPRRVFDRLVANHDGDKWIKHFSCWNQLLCMMFGQLSGRESLRDLLTCLSAHSSKYYHLGFGRNVSRSNLASANEKRDCHIYEGLANELIKEARSCCASNSEFILDLKGNVYAFDSTTISLCISAFCWATFRTTEAAIKLHTLYDVRTAIPSFVLVTPASVHDVKGLDVLVYEPGAYYVLDRGYLDSKRLYGIHCKKSFFVTRARHNTRFTVIASEHPNRALGIRSDQRVRFSSFYPRQGYPEILRRIHFYDHKEKRSFVFLTNNFDLAAQDIALLYKYRWSVELFFKWIKQHLRIETFWGTSENAVKTQVYIALATYALVAIIKTKLRTERSTYETLQIIGVSLLDKTNIRTLLESHKNSSDNMKSQYLLDFE
jgi:hypothetical protein